MGTHYCPDCGAALSDAAEECEVCGADLQVAARGPAGHGLSLAEGLLWLAGSVVVAAGGYAGAARLGLAGTEQVGAAVVAVMLANAVYLAVRRTR